MVVVVVVVVVLLLVVLVVVVVVIVVAASGGSILFPGAIPLAAGRGRRILELEDLYNKWASAN